MIKGLGLDLVKIERIERLAARWGDRFLKRVYTPEEIEYCLARAYPSQHLAARYAAKEAAMKMLGRELGRLNWLQFEISNHSEGYPEIKLKGKAEEIALERGIERVLITLTHEKEYAIAQVIGEGY